MKTETIRTFTQTGYHLLCAKFELREDFNVFDSDVTPIDAPELIASGSTLSIESFSRKSIQRANHREFN